MRGLLIASEKTEGSLYYELISLIKGYVSSRQMQANLGSRTVIILQECNFDAEDNGDDDSKILHSNDDN